MSYLIAVTFPDQEAAGKARAALDELQRRGRLSLYDAAIITRDPDDGLHIHDEIDRDVKVGTGVGGVLGMLSSSAFPIVGLVVGAAGGALVGKSLDRDIDQQFVKELGTAVQSGGSALCVLVRDAEADTLHAALEPFRGTIYQTTLDSELEEQLRAALDDSPPR